jgi:hypothetical protein
VSKIIIENLSSYCRADTLNEAFAATITASNNKDKIRMGPYHAADVEDFLLYNNGYGERGDAVPFCRGIRKYRAFCITAGGRIGLGSGRM